MEVPKEKKRKVRLVKNIVNHIYIQIFTKSYITQDIQNLKKTIFGINQNRQLIGKSHLNLLKKCSDLNMIRWSTNANKK